MYAAFLMHRGNKIEAAINQLIDACGFKDNPDDFWGILAIAVENAQAKGQLSLATALACEIQFLLPEPKKEKV